MAKIFYTLDEAAAKLKMSETQVKGLVTSGQLQEFRDRDRLMFKVDQINLLAQSEHGGEEGVIPLAESGELGAISLASDSGSGMNLESPKEQTGISIFDADQTDEADPSAVTQVTESAPTELSLETIGSGSGLLDLTREADDTSLGKDLLEEVGAQDGSTASETITEGEGADAAALFEPSAAESDVTAVAAGGGGGLMVMAEQVDGGWSGLSGGVAFGMVALLALTLSVTIFGLTGANSFGLIKMIGENFMMWVAIAAGVVILPGLIGMFVGRKG